MPKSIYESFDDAKFKALKKAKGKLSWREFIELPRLTEELKAKLLALGDVIEVEGTVGMKDMMTDIGKAILAEKRRSE